MNITIGTCSQCGGPVEVPRVWMSVIPARPTCRECGCVAVSHGPIIPMMKPPVTVFVQFTDNTATGAPNEQ